MEELCQQLPFLGWLHPPQYQDQRKDQLQNALAKNKYRPRELAKLPLH